MSNLKEKALAVAKRLKLNIVHATSDGNVFRPGKDNKPSNACLNHSRQYNKKIEEFEFSDAELAEEAKPTKVSYRGKSNPFLLELIKERGLDVGAATKNAEFVAILEAADAAQEGGSAE